MFKTELTPPLRALSALALMLPLAALAAPTITVDRVQQRYPWNGLVDIDYTVAGMDDALAFDYTLDFAYSALTAEGTLSGAAVTFADRVACELVTSNGTWRATWDASADGLSVVATSLVVTASIRRAVTATDGDYMVIDLSPGAKAKRYPVTFLSQIADPQATFNTDVYKTTKLVLKKVEKGDFWMGAGQNGDISNPASTRHRVRLTRDYYLGVFPVTQRQYLLVQGTNPARFRTNEVWQTLPVEQVSRNMVLSYNASTGAGGFATNLTRRAMRGLVRVGTFKLPTQAQWEHAARGGTLTSYWWGNDNSRMPGCAWYNATTTGPVGSKVANPWGFYDMIGGVYEWTEDGGHGTWHGTEENPDVDPLVDPSSGATDRGGCWSITTPMTCGGQDTSPATYNAATHGFRISLTCE